MVLRLFERITIINRNNTQKKSPSVVTKMSSSSTISTVLPTEVFWNWIDIYNNIPTSMKEEERRKLLVALVKVVNVQAEKIK